MPRVWSPYPLFSLVLVLIIAVLLNPRSSAKAAEPNGGQRVSYTGAVTDTLGTFLRENPSRRIVAFESHGHGVIIIVHEPVR